MFAKTFGCTRFIYNKMLEDKINYYEATGKTLKPTPAQYKEELEWLKEVDSLALANAQLHLETAYKNYFCDNKVGFPKFKKKRKGRNSYTTNCVNGNITLTHGYLKLPKIGKVKVNQHRPILKGYNLKAVTEKQTASGEYYASILYEYEMDIIPQEPKESIGLDFSMKELYVSSDGISAAYPRYYR